MKNKKIDFLLAILILFISSPLIPADKKDNEKQIQTRAISGFVPDDANKKGTTKLNFNKTVLAQGTNTCFYLGAKEAPKNAPTYSVTRVNAAMEISPITPEKITLYTEEGTEDVPNPLYGMAITNLSLYSGIYPIATCDYGTSAATAYQIYLIFDAQGHGKFQASNETTVDAAGNALVPTDKAQALVGSGTYIFAAVPQTGKAWNEYDGTDRGIAILSANIFTTPPANRSLKQLDAEKLSDDTATAKAKKLSVIPNESNSICFSAGTAASIGKALIGNDVDMYWDSGLGRLYVALSDVKRDDQAKDGGCVSIMTGYIATDATTKKPSSLDLAPILYQPSTAKFVTKNSPNFIVDFYYDTSNTDPIEISTKKVRVMHTSTGKDYLIAHCNVAWGTSPKDYNKVFALPLIGSKKADGTDQDEKLIGTLAAIDDFYNSPSNTTKMPKFDNGTPANTTPGIVVGQQQTSSPETKNITDIFIHGDSVYICINESSSTALTQNDGIFQSTALFDKDGKIINWTPWQRVMGNIEAVSGGGIDEFDCFYFLAGQYDKTENTNTVKVTRWGESENVNQSMRINSDGTVTWIIDENKNLSTILSSIFPQEQGGVFQIINFDEKTPGFKDSQFSMMVAVGYNKVALIQTGVYDSVGKYFKPTSDKFEIGKNVFVFNDQALKDIAPLCFAEVARNTNADSGWLFVGGYNGVAVLSKADGTGWDSTTGLSNLDPAGFPGTGYSFKKLSPTDPKNSFNYTRKLASVCCSNAEKLFIQTNDNLYSIKQDAAQFQAGVVSETKHLGNLPSSLRFTDLLIIPATDDASSAVITGYKFIFGSTYGLLNCNYNSLGTLSGGSANTNPVLHLNYISQTKGKNGTKGNLYALSANFLSNTAKVSRYTVDGSATSLISQIGSGEYLDLREFRGNFVTDGSFGFSLLAKGPNNNNFVDLFQIKAASASPSDHMIALDELLDLNNSNWYVGVVTRNTASGSWLVPGDWGVRVNE